MEVFDLGLCFGFQEDGSNDYMCAVLWDGPEVEGFVTYEYPPATWLIFQAKGKSQTMFWEISGSRLIRNSFPRASMKMWTAHHRKVCLWNEAEDLGEVEVWIPVKY